MTDAKKLIEQFAARQRSRVYPCPRCGKENMADDPVRNAMSRRTNVYVCDACGMQEAMEDMMDSWTPLEAWEISQHPEQFAAVTKDSDQNRHRAHQELDQTDSLHLRLSVERRGNAGCDQKHRNRGNPRWTLGAL